MCQVKPIEGLTIKTDLGIDANWWDFVFIDDINIGEFALSAPILNQELAWKIIPNPAQNRFTVKSNNNIARGEIVVRDVTGRLLIQKKINSEQMIVDSSDLPNGLYILSVTNENNTWSSKLIIRK